MRIGVISDIHGNIAAFEAALAALRGAGVDGIVCLGDIIGIGPHPEECVQAVAALPDLLACVRGNHESYLLDGIPARMDGEERDFHLWEHARLSAQSVRFLDSLPAERFLDIESKSVWAAHYPINSRDFSPVPDASDRCPEADLCLYGHDHARSILTRRGRAWANFGALGCPGRERAARAGIAEISGGGIAMHPIDAEYDVDAVISDIRALAYPAMDTILAIFYGVGSPRTMIGRG